MKPDQVQIEALCFLQVASGNSSVLSMVANQSLCEAQELAFAKLGMMQDPAYAMRRILGNGVTERHGGAELFKKYLAANDGLKSFESEPPHSTRLPVTTFCHISAPTFLFWVGCSATLKRVCGVAREPACLWHL
mgnify:CR=1 FL=1